jgi:diketogulonate reductase-like aldo/keto reductase
MKIDNSTSYQIELHAYLQQKELRELCQKYGITITAYYPLGGQSRNNYPDAWKYVRITFS